MNIRAVTQIALNTYRESIRSKLLLSLLVFGAVVVAAASFFGTVTIGDQVQVIKSFGLMCVSLFTVAFAVISGSALLFKEISRRTVYNILAKPVRRSEFILGKYLGLLYTSCVLAALMGLGLGLYLVPFEGYFDLLLLKACFFIMLELVILCAVAIFFSALVVTPMLIGVFTFGVFVAGRSTEYLDYFIQTGEATGALAAVLRGLGAVLPHLELLNVADRTVLGSPVDFGYLLWGVLYAAGYAAIALLLGNLVFQRREFN